MECNKEEALRAKGMAQKKMENKDFSGARKIAMKAQNLYPELENISQLIIVCDVHCSAENKVHGTEIDWYGILKLEPTADDGLIKKQFRKFALSLHPDKNKFAGATDAFKLIGEAQRVLLDREKRRIHDMKCRPTSVNGPPKQANRPSNVRKPPASNYCSVKVNKQCQRAPQTAHTGSYSINLGNSTAKVEVGGKHGYRQRVVITSTSRQRVVITSTSRLVGPPLVGPLGGLLIFFACTCLILYG